MARKEGEVGLVGVVRGQCGVCGLVEGVGRAGVVVRVLRCNDLTGVSVSFAR